MTYPPMWQNVMTKDVCRDDCTVIYCHFPVNFVELPMMIPGPYDAIIAICTNSISRLLLPTFVVSPLSGTSWMVTFSGLELLSPTSQSVSSSELQVLWLSRDTCTREYSLLLPILCTKVYGYNSFWKTLLSPITVFLSM